MMHARTLVMAVAILAGTGMAASASSINGTLDTVSGSGPYTWTYDAVLNGQSRIESGDYFFVADFDGYVDGTIFAPADWTGTVENTSSCPTFQDCSSDMATISNLLFTYSGMTINNPDPQEAVTLGEFGAQSIYDDEIVGFWSAQDTNDGLGDVNGTKQGNSQLIPVPMAASVPEAGTLVMLGLGLLGAGFTARRRS
jgi:hypothetical protein